MADRSALASKLGGTWFGGGLAARDRDRLVASATLRAFGVGEILLREGAECDSFGGTGFVDDIEPGEMVAVHWSWACDRLTPRQLHNRVAWTRLALQVTNRAI